MSLKKIVLDSPGKSCMGTEASSNSKTTEGCSHKVSKEVLSGWGRGKKEG